MSLNSFAAGLSVAPYKPLLCAARRARVWIGERLSRPDTEDEMPDWLRRDIGLSDGRATPASLRRPARLPFP